ncbi:hypothetical protein ACQ4PT_002188 [Festuca glaucescens]
MDAATPPVQEEPPARDWSLLPLDVLCSVFVMLGAVDVLTVMGAGFVCRSWLEAAKLPDVWRVVDMENHDALLGKDESVLRMMAKAAVDRSDGQLRVFAGMRFVSHELVKYIVERSPSLATLRLVLRVHNCFVANDEDEHALRSKFSRIKTMTIECDEEFRFRYGSDFEWDDYDFDHHVPDFEDERTDAGSL